MVFAVGIAQSVERWIVVPDVVGSNPTTHPNLSFPAIPTLPFSQIKLSGFRL